MSFSCVLPFRFYVRPIFFGTSYAASISGWQAKSPSGQDEESEGNKRGCEY